MASDDRFYQLEMRNRPVLRGDIGSLLKIEGLVVGGAGAQAILMLPDTANCDPDNKYHLSLEEWTDYLQRSDMPEVLIMPAKAFHRKVRYEISGAVQQKVWVADGYRCLYCRRPMGAVQLTIDHFLPLELGGANNTSNYLSACRKCNKDKGSQHPRDFCSDRGLDFDDFVVYLSNRKIV